MVNDDPSKTPDPLRKANRFKLRGSLPETCSQVEAQLIAFLHGGLNPKQMAAVRRHLDSCPSCRSALVQAEEMETQLRLEAAGYNPRLSRQAAGRIQTQIERRLRRTQIMKTTQKIAGGLAILLVVAFLAFGADRLLRTANPIKNPLVTNQPDANPLPNPPGQPVVDSETSNPVITFAVYDFYKEDYRTLIDQFQAENPEITVQLVNFDPSLDERSLASAADTLILPNSSLFSKRYYLDLTPFQESDQTFDSDDFWPGALAACQDPEGRQYGLPATIQPVGLFYNEEAFSQAGLSKPAPGWTWDDFRQAVIQTTRTQGDDIWYGFADDLFIDGQNTVIAPLIDDLLTQSGGEIDPASLASQIQWYLDLAKDKQLYAASIYPNMIESYSAGADYSAWSEAWNETWTGWHNLFVNNQPAMWKGDLLHSDWAELQMAASSNGGLSVMSSSPQTQGKEGIGWAPYPVSTSANGGATTPANVDCLTVSSGTRYPQAAWAWVDFLSRHPYVPTYMLAAPARQSAAESQGFWERVEEKNREAVKFALEHGWYASSYPTELDEINQAVQRVIKGEAGLVDALSEAGQNIAKAAASAEAESTPEVPIEVVPPLPTSAPGITYIDYANTAMEAEAAQALADEFQRLHPDITIRLTHNTNEQGLAALAHNYDCFSWFAPSIGGSQEASEVYSLAEFMTGSDQALSEDFSKETLAEYSLNDQLVGLPLSYLPTMVYYNADLLERLGIQPPGNDWDYAQALELIQAVAARSGSEDLYGMALNLNYREADLLMSGQGISLANLQADPPEIYFDAPETVQWVQWLAGLAKDKVIYPVSVMPVGTYPENFSTARQLILDGKIAFWLSFPSRYGSTYQLMDPDFEIGMAPIPQMPSQTVVAGSNLPRGQYISRQAEDPQACWEWLKFVSEHPEALEGAPARRSMLTSASWAAKVGEQAALAFQTALARRAPASQTNPNRLGSASDWWQNLIVAVVNGGDPQQLLSEAQRKADLYTACLATAPASDEQARSEAEDACFQQVETSSQ